MSILLHHPVTQTRTQNKVPTITTKHPPTSMIDARFIKARGRNYGGGGGEKKRGMQKSYLSAGRVFGDEVLALLDVLLELWHGGLDERHLKVVHLSQAKILFNTIFPE